MSARAPATGLEDAIRETCRRHRVQLAYLFGPHARGTADAESDVDVAVLASPSLSKEERNALKLRLGHALAGTLPIDSGEVDVAVLQDAPTLLRYNVVRGGTPVFAARPSIWDVYELGVQNCYDDERPLLDREAELTIDRILSRPA